MSAVCYLTCCSRFAVSLLGVLLVVSTQSLVQAQPTPLAVAQVGERTLELYAVVKKPFGLTPHDRMLQLVDDEIMEQLNMELGITAWKTKHNTGAKEEYVLGFLVRNADGSLPAANVRTASAYRAVASGGNESRYWPAISESPIQELSGYQWDFQLAPLVISVPKGARQLQELEGVVVRTPGVKGSAVFETEDFGDSAKIDRGLIILPLTTEPVMDGFGCTFGILRAKQKSAKYSKPKQGSGGSVLETLAQLNLGISLGYNVILPDGTRKPFNLQSQTTLGSAKARKLLANVKRKLPSLVAEFEIPPEVVSFVMKNDASVDLVRVGFQQTPAMRGVQVRYETSSGGPIPERFVMRDIPLMEAGEASVINEFIGQLSIASPPPPPAVTRIWRDTSGKFSVEAKLVSSDETSIRIEKTDGGQLTVPKAKLSTEDLNFLEGLK